MGKYEPLASRLKDTSSDVFDANFEQIEEILKFKLPPSARRHRTWWGNCFKGTHSQAKGWIDAGWETREIDLKNEVVRFERTYNAVRADRDISNVDLWDKARGFTGISDRKVLEKAAVEALIRQAAIEQLIALGGTMPGFKSAPRRRADG